MDVIDKIINIISIIVITFNLFVLMTIVRIHFKDSFYRKHFFQVLLIQIIFEFLMNLLILIAIIQTLNDAKVFSFLPMIVNFFYNCDMLYNSLTILFLINTKTKNDDTGDVYNNDDLSKTEDMIIIPDDNNNNYNNNSSIKLKKHSFKMTHFFSLFFSFIQTLLYHLLFINTHSNDLNWYFYFLSAEIKDFIGLTAFLFNYVFLFLSIKYCLLKPSLGITKLKYYSIYVLIFSCISLLYPLLIILNICGIKGEDKEDTIQIIIRIIYAFFFLCYLIITTLFRLYCYYVQNILSSSKSNMFVFGLKILFTGQRLPQPKFIDFNNSYLIHSLSFEKDISVAKTQHKQGDENNNENNENSNSYSLVDTII